MSGNLLASFYLRYPGVVLALFVMLGWKGLIGTELMFQQGGLETKHNVSMYIVC